MADSGDKNLEEELNAAATLDEPANVSEIDSVHDDSTRDSSTLQGFDEGMIEQPDQIISESSLPEVAGEEPSERRTAGIAEEFMKALANNGPAMDPEEAVAKMHCSDEEMIRGPEALLEELDQLAVERVEEIEAEIEINTKRSSEDPLDDEATPRKRLKKSKDADGFEHSYVSRMKTASCPSAGDLLKTLSGSVMDLESSGSSRRKTDADARDELIQTLSGNGLNSFVSDTGETNRFMDTLSNNMEKYSASQSQCISSEDNKLVGEAVRKKKKKKKKVAAARTEAVSEISLNSENVRVEVNLQKEDTFMSECVISFGDIIPEADFMHSVGYAAEEEVNSTVYFEDFSGSSFPEEVCEKRREENSAPAEFLIHVSSTSDLNCPVNKLVDSKLPYSDTVGHEKLVSEAEINEGTVAYEKQVSKTVRNEGTANYEKKVSKAERSEGTASHEKQVSKAERSEGTASHEKKVSKAERHERTVGSEKQVSKAVRNEGTASNEKQVSKAERTVGTASHEKQVSKGERNEGTASYKKQVTKPEISEGTVGYEMQISKAERNEGSVSNEKQVSEAERTVGTASHEKQVSKGERSEGTASYKKQVTKAEISKGTAGYEMQISKAERNEGSVSNEKQVSKAERTVGTAGHEKQVSKGERSEGTASYKKQVTKPEISEGTVGYEMQISKAERNEGSVSNEKQVSKAERTVGTAGHEKQVSKAERSEGTASNEKQISKSERTVGTASHEKKVSKGERNEGTASYKKQVTKAEISEGTAGYEMQISKAERNKGSVSHEKQVSKAVRNEGTSGYEKQISKAERKEGTADHEKQVSKAKRNDVTVQYEKQVSKAVRNEGTVQYEKQVSEAERKEGVADHEKQVSKAERSVGTASHEKQVSKAKRNDVTVQYEKQVSKAERNEGTLASLGVPQLTKSVSKTENIAVENVLVNPAVSSISKTRQERVPVTTITLTKDAFLNALKRGDYQIVGESGLDEDMQKDVRLAKVDRRKQSLIVRTQTAVPLEIPATAKTSVEKEPPRKRRCRSQKQAAILHRSSLPEDQDLQPLPPLLQNPDILQQTVLLQKSASQQTAIPQQTPILDQASSPGQTSLPNKLLGPTLNVRKSAQLSEKLERLQQHEKESTSVPAAKDSSQKGEISLPPKASAPSKTSALPKTSVSQQPVVLKQTSGSKEMSVTRESFAPQQTSTPLHTSVRHRTGQHPHAPNQLSPSSQNLLLNPLHEKHEKKSATATAVTTTSQKLPVSTRLGDKLAKLNVENPPTTDNLQQKDIIPAPSTNGSLQKGKGTSDVTFDVLKCNAKSVTLPSTLWSYQIEAFDKHLVFLRVCADYFESESVDKAIVFYCDSNKPRVFFRGKQIALPIGRLRNLNEVATFINNVDRVSFCEGTGITQRPFYRHCHGYLDLSNPEGRCSLCLEERRRLLLIQMKKLKEKFAKLSGK